jgi:hypothetical protein
MNNDKEIKITLNLSKKNNNAKYNKNNKVKNDVNKVTRNDDTNFEGNHDIKKVAKLDLDKLVQEENERNLQSTEYELKKQVNVESKEQIKINKENVNSNTSKKKKNKDIPKKINTSKSINKAKVSNRNPKPKKEVHNENNLDDVVEMLNDHNEKIKEQRIPRIGKTQDEVKNEIKVNEEIKNKKIVSLRKLVTSIICIILIIIIYLFFEYSSIIGIRLPTNMNKDVDIDIVSTDNDIYDTYNNELLIYSNSTISTYNKYGDKTWEYILDTSFNPNIYIYKNYLVVANNSSGLVYLFNNKNEILNMKVDGQIEYIYIDKNGNMAIEYSTNSYKKIIGVYNQKGKNLYNTYLEYGTIVDIKLLNNASKLIITQANSNSFKIGCTISMLDSTSEESELTELLKLDNNFIFDVEYVNNSLVILSDNQIIKYNLLTNESSVLKEYDSSQILFISILDNYYISVEKNLDDNNDYSIVNCDFENNNICTLNVENSPKYLVSSKYLNYFVYQNKLQVFNKWGIEVLSKDLNIVPKNIIVFNNNKSAALIYTNKIEIINL